MIPGCKTSGRCGTKFHFPNVLVTFGVFFASVLGGVGSCGGWWILGQSYMTCLAVSSSTPHFLQMVSSTCPILSSQYLRSG